MSEAGDAAFARSAMRLPHPALRGLVTGYHGYRYLGGPAGVHHGLPSTSLTVVLAFDQQVDVGWLDEPTGRRRHWTLASGLGMLPAGIHHDGNQHGIQLDLTPPGARAFFGLPAAELGRQLVSLPDLIGPRAARLYDDVVGASGWPSRFAALDLALLELASEQRDRSGTVDKTLTHAWRRLHVSGGRIQIADLAREVGWSRRQLSHRFAREYGIGPKQTARLVRFTTARQLVPTGLGLAEVAARCGYADQAHLTREWRELAGAPPTTWLRQERTFLQDQSPPR